MPAERRRRAGRTEPALSQRPPDAIHAARMLCHAALRLLPDSHDVLLHRLLLRLALLPLPGVPLGAALGVEDIGLAWWMGGAKGGWGEIRNGALAFVDGVLEGGGEVSEQQAGRTTERRPS